MPCSAEQDFISLMNQYSHFLTGLCISLRDVHLAQDVVQETFLRAWRKWPLRPDTESTIPADVLLSMLGK